MELRPALRRGRAACRAACGGVRHARHTATRKGPAGTMNA
ncbi:MAG TPA: phage baseplate assembly protein V, partial [Delftia acidovorans]|nr:phage baseplate assembly protein V [Delftia acidovorans]